MATIQLSPDGPSYPIPHRVLVKLAKEVSKNADYDSELSEALLHLGIPSLTEAMSERSDDEVDEDDFATDFDRPSFAFLKSQDDIDKFFNGAATWDLYELAYGIDEVKTKRLLTS